MRHKILSIAAICSAVILLQSCSSSRTSTMTMTVPTTSKPAVSKPTTGKKSSAQYDDSEKVAPIKSASAKTEEEQLGGEWTVFTIKGKRLQGESRPYITFNLEDHRLYGNNGCNVINASFKVPVPGEIAISQMISTMMSCHDAPYEQAVNEAIDATRYFSVTRQGHEYYLELSNAQHRPVMTLRKHNMDFLNGPWTATEIEGEAVDNPDMRMVIDIPEQAVHGHTGCNIFNGELLIDPDKSNSIQFSNLGVTRMACQGEAARLETALLVALEKIEYAHKGKNSTIILSDKNDNPVMVLKKIVDNN